MPETEFPEIAEELAALEQAAKRPPEDELADDARRRVEFARQRESVEKNSEKDRANDVLAKIESGTAGLRGEHQKAAEEWRRLTGRA